MTKQRNEAGVTVRGKRWCGRVFYLVRRRHDAHWKADRIAEVSGLGLRKVKEFIAALRHEGR